MQYYNIFKKFLKIIIYKSFKLYEKKYRENNSLYFYFCSIYYCKNLFNKKLLNMIKKVPYMTFPLISVSRFKDESHFLKTSLFLLIFFYFFFLFERKTKAPLTKVTKTDVL